MTRPKRLTIVSLGIWIWGTVTVVIALTLLIFLIIASFYISPNQPSNLFTPGVPAWIPRDYLVLKDHNQLVAAILAVSGLAWSYFFQWKER